MSGPPGPDLSKLSEPENLFLRSALCAAVSEFSVTEDPWEILLEGISLAETLTGYGEAVLVIHGGSTHLVPKINGEIQEVTHPETVEGRPTQLLLAAKIRQKKTSQLIGSARKVQPYLELATALKSFQALVPTLLLSRPAPGLLPAPHVPPEKAPMEIEPVVDPPPAEPTKRPADETLSAEREKEDEKNHPVDEALPPEEAEETPLQMEGEKSRSAQKRARQKEKRAAQSADSQYPWWESRQEHAVNWQRDRFGNWHPVDNPAGVTAGKYKAWVPKDQANKPPPDPG